MVPKKRRNGIAYLCFCVIIEEASPTLEKHRGEIMHSQSTRTGVKRGYTIPLFDLAWETERVTVVDKEEGQYLGHVTSILDDDGKTIVAVYPKGHGRGPIVMKRSTDGGLTWSDRLPTPKSWETSREVPTIFRTFDPDGNELWLLFSGLYPIRLSVSKDKGETWSELEPIGDYGGIVAMSDLLPLSQPGHYVAFFHDDGRFFKGGPGEVWGSPAADYDGGMRVYAVFSEDGGLTWSEPHVIVEHPQGHLCEAGAVYSPDKKEMALVMRENRRQFNSMVSFSTDEGRTWTEPRELHGALTGDRHTIRYLKDGRIVAVFRDMCHVSPTRGDFVAWIGSYEDLKNGGEGDYRVRLGKNYYDCDSTYPGVQVLPDGTVVAITYGHWNQGEEPYIISVRFHPEELDARLGRK